MSLSQLPARDRIIRSLFSEKDETGAALESYITHVKIFEDVQYPSEPPPAPTPQENLKERYILLSVKKNGRVRMHKSRANDNGTFQIGKTWNLEDLQKIQDTDKRGLIINLLKPYYWTMETSKDKYMFVSALTKVYKKYTGGRMFEMLNFESHNVPTDRPAPVAQRQERSVSAQVSTQRLTPQPVSPVRSQRAVSDVHDKLSRESPRQASIPVPQSLNKLNIPSYAPITSPAAPNSRVASSHYGGNGDRLSTATDSVRSPASGRSQQRSVSSTTDERLRRGAVPFASPPLVSTRTMSIENNDVVRNGDTKPQSRVPLADPRPIKSYGNDLGSPMSFDDARPPGSPVTGPPEKSLRRLAVESPASEMAPALPRHFDNPPQSPMSPPPPAKSPARRPSNIRLNTNGSSKVLHERMTGMISPAESGSNSPVPEVPSLPSKSGARSADIHKPQDRGLPWATPVGKTDPEDYFSKPAPSAAKPLGPPDSANTFQSVIEPDANLSPSAPDPSAITNNMQLNQAVDVEPSSSVEPLDDESAYIDEAIRDFRWTAQHGAELLASRLEDELAVLEAANVHTMVDNDARIEDLMVKLDTGIAQCDDMINILTIYEFELATISDNVKHIEGQSQGLQVQTANQQSLVNEISRVLTSITISETDLDVLKGRGGNLESLEGVTNIEASLVNLYRALKSLRDEKSHVNDQSMSALQPKKKEYMNESNAFLARLSQYLQIKFQAALLTKEAESVSRFDPSRVLQGHEKGLMALAPYAALMLYAREIEPSYHSEYMRAYASAAKSSWQGPILDFIGQWRSRAKKATPEENEHIFTAARDQQSLGPTRNATLKRSNTLAKQIKSVTTTKSEKDVDSRPPASDVFRTILDNLALLLSNEQNFLVSFFHLSSFNNYEFPDYVELEYKSRITINSLDDHKPTEPSRTFAKEKYILMESIFSWLNGDLAELVDYLAKIDSIQVVGIIKSIEVVSAEWVHSDQEFMLKTLQRLKDRLMGLLNRFIEAQVRAIKDIKVTSKKRKGVIPVFEIFPDFVERVETQLQSTESENVAINQLEIRETVNEAYEQMSKAMFQSVKTLASSATVTAHGLADPEDKEILNYHILMVQNMHQYLQALQSRNNVILEDFQYTAQKQYTEHLTSYTRQIIVRPIGRLMEFTEAFAKSQTQGEDTLSKASFSSTSLRRLLSDHDERDMRKGISAMRKRVEKHFSDEDGGSPTLLAAAWKTTQDEYLSVVDRLLAIVQAHYSDVKPDWSRQDLTAAFAKRDM